MSVLLIKSSLDISLLDGVDGVGGKVDWDEEEGGTDDGLQPSSELLGFREFIIDLSNIV